MLGSLPTISFFAILGASVVNAFTSVSTHGMIAGRQNNHIYADTARKNGCSHQLNLTPNEFPMPDVQDMTVARTAFALCFFGALGTAAVGRAVIPITWTKYWETQALKGLGTTLGGEDLELVGYPEPVYTNDVNQVIDYIENNMTIPEIVANFPIENQIEGYLRYESIAKAFPSANPIAVRAVFDSMALGINKNQVAPRVAMQRLESYKEDLSLLKMELNKGRTVGVTALILLLGLLGACDYFTLFHLWHGWFPLWPGPFADPMTIPDYWMNDIPS